MPYHTLPYHTIAFLCHIILYHTVPCMQYYAILLSYYTIAPRSTLLYYGILYHAIPYYTIPYYTILCYTILYHTLPYHTIPYHAIPYYTLLYHSIPYFTYPTMLYHPIQSLIAVWSVWDLCFILRLLTRGSVAVLWSFCLCSWLLQCQLLRDHWL